MLGDIAEGGGDITIVLELASVSTFEFDVLFVFTLDVVCAVAGLTRTIINPTTMSMRCIIGPLNRGIC